MGTQAHIPPLLTKLINIENKPKGPATGPKKKKKKGAPLTEADIPWHRVNTHFDLAREHLKVSLDQLNKDQFFSVIFFGTEADLVEPCTGMIKASKGNVKKMIKALDAIEIGSPTAARPDGVLRGLTNLHAGVRRAFMVKNKGFVDEHEYVDFDAIEEGPNTIFILSDGTPSWDDWGQKDKNYEEDRLGDPETREPVSYGAIIRYFGPYVEHDHLLTDVQRMNMFRETEINCIGIGEADTGLLQQLARLGMGNMVSFGN